MTASDTSVFAQLEAPCGIVVDLLGNVIALGCSSGAITKVSPAGVISTIAQLGREEMAWRGLAEDAKGNFYVSHFTLNEVLKVTPAGVVSLFAKGVSQPTGLAIDALGYLYISSFDTGKIYRVATFGLAGQGLTAIGALRAAALPNPAVVTEFASGLSSPGPLAFDATGNLFVGNQGDNSISKIPPAGGLPFTVAHLADTPVALTVSGDNLLVATANRNSGSSSLSLLTAEGSLITTGRGFSSISGMEADHAGSLFITDASANVVQRVTGEVRLSISLSGPGTVTLEWPISFTSFALESAEHLAGPSDWKPVPVPANIRDGHYEVGLRTPNVTTFYRLQGK